MHVGVYMSIQSALPTCEFHISGFNQLKIFEENGGAWQCMPGSHSWEAEVEGSLVSLRPSSAIW